MLFSPLKEMKFFLQCNLFKSPPIAGIETMLVGLHFSCSFQNYPCYWRDVSGSLSFFDLKSGASNAKFAFLAAFLQLDLSKMFHIALSVRCVHSYSRPPAQPTRWCEEAGGEESGQQPKLHHFRFRKNAHEF